MSKARKKFLCLDCNVDTGAIYEHYMLVDSTWYLIHDSNRGMLCIGCIEKRLGRQLNANDFNDSYLNNPTTAPKSARLMERMSNHGSHNSFSDR